MNNIFDVCPYKQRAVPAITGELIRILKSGEDLSKLEVEVKWAQITSFCANDSYGYVQRLKPDQQAQCLVMYDFVRQQQELGLLTLRRISCQNIIQLNPLGYQIYQVKAGYYERSKFYTIRDILIKICRFNQLAKKDTRNPRSIYADLSSIGANSRMVLTALNEIRLDIYLKGDGPSRFSYTKAAGWIKTIKNRLTKQQFDLMLSEKTFRVAINREDESEPNFEELSHLRQQLLSKSKLIEIRLKNTTKIVKNSSVQISLSEVYEPTRVETILQKLGDLLIDNVFELERYLIELFCNFYAATAQGHNYEESKHEIQIEFTKQAITRLASSVRESRHREVEMEVELLIHDISSLGASDHRLKVMEIPWLNKLAGLNPEVDGMRLENEYGSYMRDLVDEQMHIE